MLENKAEHTQQQNKQKDTNWVTYKLHLHNVISLDVVSECWNHFAMYNTDAACNYDEHALHHYPF